MTAFDRFVEAYHRHFTRDPNRRVELGIQGGLDRLPDPSSEARTAAATEAQALLGDLDALESSPLDFDQRLDRDLARLALEAEIHRETLRFNGETTWAQMPTVGAVVGDPIFTLFMNDPRPEGERLADILGRLAGVRDYVEGRLRSLSTPVERWVEIDLERTRSLPDLFQSVRRWAEAVSWPDSGQLADAIRSAEAALQRYAAELSCRPTVRRFQLGAPATERIIALGGIELSPAQLQRIAVEFLTRTRAEIEDLRARLVRRHGLDAESPAEEVHRFLNRRYRVECHDLDGILEAYRDEHAKVSRFVQQRRLFPIPEDQELYIVRTPAFMTPSIPAGAMNPPPPFRDGIRRSIVFLTLSEELRDEHTRVGIPMMMVHEGIPGHHLQLASAAAHPSVIRRHADFLDQCEGWTTMLEDYMLDVGYRPELADEIRFCAKREISRLAARVGIDLYFMTGDPGYLDLGVDIDASHQDPFENAGALLRKVTGFTAARTRAELNWYSQERGYPLSYLAGNHLVWELKRDFQAAQRGRSDDLDRVFHRVFLESGNMPVSCLRRVFQHRQLLPA